jgi:tetratricopeptide (TPR) repeat protein
VAVDSAAAEQQLKDDTKTVITFGDFQSDLATTYMARGVILTELGQDAEAIAEHQKAHFYFDQLVKAYPAVTQYQGERAWVSTYLGVLCNNSKRELDDARQDFERLLRDTPNVIRLKAGAARNRAARGEYLVRTGASPAAIAEGRRLLRAAYADQLDIARSDRENFDFRSDLKQTETWLIAR